MKSPYVKYTLYTLALLAAVVAFLWWTNSLDVQSQKDRDARMTHEIQVCLAAEGTPVVDGTRVHCEL